MAEHYVRQKTLLPLQNPVLIFFTAFQTVDTVHSINLKKINTDFFIIIIQL